MDVDLWLHPVVAFLIGSLPFAWLIVRIAKGIDVRTIGSGNVGATNASRAFTTKGGRLAAFLAVYVLDAGKGFAAVGIGWATEDNTMTVLCAAAAVLGHVFTPWLRFRGGKGVATATGALFGLDWRVTAIALGVFFLVRFTAGQVFFGSIALGLALPLAVVVMHGGAAFGAQLPLFVLCCVLAVLLCWTHRSNLRKHFAARAAGSA